jgi:hypothetical protein
VQAVSAHDICDNNESTGQDSLQMRFPIIENHLILYPSEKKYESLVDVASVGTPNRLDAISAFLSALKKQIGSFDDLNRSALNNPKYFKTLYAEPISMPPRTTVLKGLVRLLSKHSYAILTIEDRQISLDLIEPLKGSQIRSARRPYAEQTGI